MHALKHIYKDDHCVPTLGELTDRISTRMIELADDIDMSVAMAVCAIAFVKKLLRSLLFNDLLFWQQVYYSLEFFLGRLIELGFLFAAETMMVPWIICMNFLLMIQQASGLL